MQNFSLEAQPSATTGLNPFANGGGAPPPAPAVKMLKVKGKAIDIAAEVRRALPAQPGRRGRRGCSDNEANGQSRAGREQS